MGKLFFLSNAEAIIQMVIHLSSFDSSLVKVDADSCEFRSCDDSLLDTTPTVPRNATIAVIIVLLVCVWKKRNNNDIK